MDGHIPKEQVVSVLLPHELLHALSEHEYVFNSVMLGNLSEDARVSFWEHLATLKPWENHPGLKLPFNHLIPITIHGDGAEMYTNDEFFVYSFSSVFGTQGVIQDVLQLQYPVLAIPERWMRSAAASRFKHPYFSLGVILYFLLGEARCQQDSGSPLRVVLADIERRGLACQRLPR